MIDTLKSTPFEDIHRMLRLQPADPDNWVPAVPGADHNVVIVGGGQTGSALAFALRRAGIGGVDVVDAAADGSRSGSWLTHARMQTLRTAKELVGPECGVSALGFRAWYEAQHGSQAYAELGKIPRVDWAQYLAWFREVTQTPVRYRTRLLRIEPVLVEGRQLLKLHLLVNGQGVTETTRKLVLANGVAGSGAPQVPALLHQAISQGLAFHSSSPIDFAAFAGKAVAVLGAAASAFDAAAVALEHGAAQVHLFSRRSALAATPVTRLRGHPGYHDNYLSLPDDVRWHHALRYQRAGSTAPPESVRRVLRFPNFHLHLAAPWHAVEIQEGKLVTTVRGQSFAFDVAVAATGFTSDLSQRTELADFAPLVLRWRDRLTSAQGAAHPALANAPYLGGGLEYLEQMPGSAPWLRNVHAFNPGGFVSTGLPLGDVPSMRPYVPLLVRRISRDLLLADLAIHEARASLDIAPDFDETLYAGAVWQAYSADRRTAG